MGSQSSSSVVSTLLIICAVAIALGSLFMMGKLIKKKISKARKISYMPEKDSREVLIQSEGASNI